MCARLLACPLCSQPGFLTVDALRAGLVSVATRPLICPVCNEVLLGIDKLTIHLFGHTINLENNTAESPKRMDIVVPSEHLIAIHNAHNIALQNWNALKTQQLDKVQASNTIESGDDRICIKSSEPGVSIAENKISIINSQSQAPSQNLFARNANQRSFISDDNYDLIKVNILPQPNENHNIALKSAVNAQQGILRTADATQQFCNDNVKHLNVSQENTQAEKAMTSNLFAAIKMTGTVDSNIYQNIERECIESNNNQCVAKENLTINLADKGDDFTNFQSIQNTLLACTDASPEECNDKQSLFNRKKTMLETNNDNQEDNLEHKKILPHIQTSAFSGTVASKEKVERCNICGFHFSDANILALHKQLVHEQDSINIPSKILKNYSCHLCSKVFKMRGSLMVHMRVAHVGRNLGSLPKDQTELTCNDDGYNCPTCGKKFKKEQHVIQHLKTHEGKQWECDICSKMFTTKYFLKKHKRLHSGEMPYKCKICDKSFTFQQSYHKHRLYHKDDKPHTCTTCGRSFKELSTLHNHERIHTGEKPFACETCGKCFRQRVSYLVHRRIHTGVMPYKCTMCGKSFRYKVSQRTHKCPTQTSGNTQQLCNDAIAQGTDNTIVKPEVTNTLQDSQSCVNALGNEDDKFILMINDEGQHVLALHSDINDMSSFKKKEQNLFENTKTKNAKDKTWDTNNLNSIDFEESAGSVNKSNNEKLDMKTTNDFFSMVISPFENSVSSPTFEMEHLRVSSPKQREDSIDSYTADFSLQASDNARVNTVKSTVEQNFSHDKDINDPLQTINEESLKELLYGMDRK
ncbi:zinc finger protein 62 [Ooceraea biroi]|uniref:zinc finger protein 62 n=1 Tax=Ooceraea biroi TaxID=2015173 RepID=UPI000F093EE7|nr:zinc finger protein 62 [Ooceraea biroi]